MRRTFRLFTTRPFLAVAAVLLCAAVIYLNGSVAHYKKKGLFQVNIAIQTDLLKQKLASPPQWMLDQIEKDLSPFMSSGITSGMLSELFQGDRIEKYHLARFTIKKGHIAFSIDDKNIDNRPFRHTLAAIRKLNEMAPLPDVDFVVSIEDGYDKNPGFPLCPCFAFSKGQGVVPFVLIPDFKALTGYPSLREEIRRGNQKFPWDRKESKAFWRGASTGGYLTASTWDLIPRSKLVFLSLERPGEIDARFSGAVQCTADVPGILKAKKMLSKRVDQADHLKYKYLVDVDGNACTFERLFWLLLSNSTVFKQTSSNIQWYHGGLEPYRHYIPIKEDLSDLPEQIEWARQHDSEARLIAEYSTEFVKNNLSIEDVYVYLHHLLTAYARLQR